MSKSWYDYVVEGVGEAWDYVSGTGDDTLYGDVKDFFTDDWIETATSAGKAITRMQDPQGRGFIKGGGPSAYDKTAGFQLSVPKSGGMAGIKQATKLQAMGFTESKHSQQLMSATKRLMTSNNPAIIRQNQRLAQKGISISPTIVVGSGTDVPSPSPRPRPKKVKV